MPNTLTCWHFPLHGRLQFNFKEGDTFHMSVFLCLYHVRISDGVRGHRSRPETIIYTRSSQSGTSIGVNIKSFILSIFSFARVHIRRTVRMSFRDLSGFISVRPVLEVHPPDRQCVIMWTPSSCHCSDYSSPTGHFILGLICRQYQLDRTARSLGHLNARLSLVLSSAFQSTGCRRKQPGLSLFLRVGVNRVLRLKLYVLLNSAVYLGKGDMGRIELRG